MPELPEVETFARQIRPHVLHKIILAVTVTPKGEKMILPVSSEQLNQRMSGTSFSALNRRGKYLIFDLANAWHIVAHLRMSGRFTITEHEPDKSIHNRLFIKFADDTYLNFIDTRRFATFHLLKDTSESNSLNTLGPDALSNYWNKKTFAQALNKYQRGIYKVLLDQKVISGIGNIYANESLYRTKINPELKASKLTATRASLLLKNIISILNEALAFKGTSLIDNSYKDIEGNTGEFKSFLKVYGKEGKPCERCGTIIERKRIGGRSVYYCKKCQKD